MKVRVIDSPCGTGKTEWAIRYMNENSENSRFIYVTPYLDEIKRVRDSVNFTMLEPKKGSKSKDLQNLIVKGKHIATTHALFGMGDNSLLPLIESQGYELVLDEVMTVLEPLELGEGDIQTLLKSNYVYISDDGVVSITDEGWDAYEKRLKYKEEFDIIKTGNVLLISNCMAVWEFPINLLNGFEKITILTYMFKQQTMSNYLFANNAEFEYYYLENYRLIQGNCSYNGEMYAKLVNIYEGKLNNIGTKDGSLSSSWYLKPDNYPTRKILENNTYNFFRHVSGASVEKTLWTCKKDKREKKPLLSIKSYLTSFLDMKARATNLYADRDTCAYLVNRYENPIIHNYFVKHGLSVNNDMYALSELIQWLFRSAIRKGKPINLYIPSKRMRSLLTAWLNGTFDETYNKKD